MQNFFPPKYVRDIFMVSDGGTLGVDWNLELPSTKEEIKPILLLLPGLSGGNTELYLTTMINAFSKDYKAGVILLRGAAGLPITSARLSGLLASDDAKEAIEWVYNKYVKKEGGGKRTRLYVFGPSMGAN